MADDSELLKRARERFDRVVESESENRSAALDDLRFKVAEQWPPDIKAQRSLDKRPCITINKMKTFVHQITNEQRQNRPQINVVVAGEGGDKKAAQMRTGLIRQIQRTSDADVAYDTAFDGAVSNGFGYWRILTEYEGEDSFNQRLAIKRIRNPFTVYLDPEHQMPDGSDCKWAFVTEMVDREEFKAQYPKAQPIEWEMGGIGESLPVWADAKQVRVAEYFEVETATRTLVALANGFVGYRDGLADEVKQRIKDDPEFVIDSRESECKTVQWYKLTGQEVLERREWPGRWIPIVEVVGDETDIEGRNIKSGLIRDAKDPQRTYNYAVTATIETVALAPKAPYIMAEGQDEGYESMWNEANQRSFSRLIYKPTTIEGQSVAAPRREPSVPAPQGWLAIQQAAAQDMMTTTGVRFDSTLQERTSDESGIALAHLKANTELGSFHYIDNFGRSLKHTGRILLDLIPKVYDTQRMLTILGEDGKEERVQVDPNQAKAVDRARTGGGKSVQSYNTKLGEYEVAVVIGPSYQTKMAEATSGMMEFGKAFPSKADLIADLVAKNQQWPGSDEIARRIEMTLPPGMVQPDMGDVDPQVAALIGQQQQQLQQAQQMIQQMGQALQEKGSELALKDKQIDRDFEAKMAKVAADMEGKMLDHVSERLDLIMQAVQNIEQKQETEETADSASPTMPANGAMQ